MQQGVEPPLHRNGLQVPAACHARTQTPAPLWQQAHSIIVRLRCERNRPAASSEPVLLARPLGGPNLLHVQLVRLEKEPHLLGGVDRLTGLAHDGDRHATRPRVAPILDRV